MIGWTTKVTEYNMKNTMPARISVTIPTTKAQTRTSISAGVRYCWLGLFNFLLQYRCYKIFRTGLCELATRLLALRCIEFVRVLTGVSVVVITSH